MPGPVVYVVAAIGAVGAMVAFHQFVYEPHLAPKLEALATNFLESRRQKRAQRGRLVAASPVEEHGDENNSRRTQDRSRDREDDSNGTSIELERLEMRTRDEWREPSSTSGLRRRRTAGAMEESYGSLPHVDSSPTHVLFDMSDPLSPEGPSRSLDTSPSQSSLLLDEPRGPFTPSPQVMSHRLPTPVSDHTLSPRILSPTAASSLSSSSRGHSTEDLLASRLSAYNTPLGGSMLSEGGHAPFVDPLTAPSPRQQSPFSDVHVVSARSSPEHVLVAPGTRSPSMASDLTLGSDDEFDVLSPRSGMFSPARSASPGDLLDPFEAASEASWASVGRRSPTDF